MSKQFFCLYFKEADTLVIQTAPIHDTNDSITVNPNGVTTATHSTRTYPMEVVGFTLAGVMAGDVSLLSLLNLVGPGLGVDLQELAGALMHVEAQVKNSV